MTIYDQNTAQHQHGLHMMELAKKREAARGTMGSIPNLPRIDLEEQINASIKRLQEDMLHMTVTQLEKVASTLDGSPEPTLPR
jgi:hypothetical protein